MSMYELFATDIKSETKGVCLDYGDFRITIARAGGANKKYERTLLFKTKPYKRAMDQDNLDPDIANRLLQEVYAETVILNWEVKRNGEWVQGIDPPPTDEDPSGVVPFNKENILRAWQPEIGVPELFRDIVSQANQLALFKAEIQEIEVKN